MAQPSSREKMILSTTLLLREQGYTGTSFGDVLEHSGAPRGSIYHHFPGGKAQLVQEALEFASRFIDATLQPAVEAQDPIAALGLFADGWRRQLKASDYRAGCPIVAVANEAHDEAPELIDATAVVFDRWNETVADLLHARGVPRARARRLARLTVAAIEGAVVLCRAHRSMAPLDDVLRELEATYREAIATTA